MEYIATINQRETLKESFYIYFVTSFEVKTNVSQGDAYVNLEKISNKIPLGRGKYCQMKKNRGPSSPHSP